MRLSARHAFWRLRRLSDAGRSLLRATENAGAAIGQHRPAPCPRFFGTDHRPAQGDGRRILRRTRIRCAEPAISGVTTTIGNDLIDFRAGHNRGRAAQPRMLARVMRSEEHTSELQSLMRKSYAVYCLQKKQ